MVTVVVLTFVIGYLAIVFEHPLKLDKTVPALIMGAMCWAFVSLGGLPLVDHHGAAAELEPSLLHHLGKIAEILVFLIGAMTVVELVDMHKGFSVITSAIKTRKKTVLLWLITILTFFLSAVLDNLTCTIVMVSLIKKMLKNKEERLYFASIIVIAANAGGAWSPIGDVTTTMLWIGNRISTVNLIALLILPSIVCAVVPAFLFSRQAVMQGEIEPIEIEDKRSDREKSHSSIMLWVGLLGLMFVPVFKTVTHLPPYVGMMLVLGIVWLVSERLHPDEATMDHGHLAGAKHALSRIDTSSILFFLGILLTVASLESLGVLTNFAKMLDGALPAKEAMFSSVTGGDIVMILLGFGSAVVDNVPLVAAAMGMYSVGDFPVDAKLWHFLAYTAGTGGSMLIIGSAAGVAAMGMEQIDFMWYVRKISWIAMIGFLAGAAVFLLLYPGISSVLPQAATTIAPVGH